MKQTDNIELCLRELGYAVVPIEGTSMWPLLKQGKTFVQLEAKDGKRLKKGDIILYRKKDGTLVLHRIIKVVGEDTFSVLGDHQWKNAEQVRYDQILAVAPLFYFKEKRSAALGHKRLHRQKLSTRNACRGTRLFFENGNKVDEKTLWYRLYKRIWNGSLTLRRC